MNNEWIVLPKDSVPIRRHDPYTKLLDIMNYLEEEGESRFTEEQARTIQSLITSLIDNIRSFKHSKKR